MLKKYSVLRGFVVLCVGLLVFSLPSLQAQDSDFVTSQISLRSQNPS